MVICSSPIGSYPSYMFRPHVNGLSPEEMQVYDWSSYHVGLVRLIWCHFIVAMSWWERLQVDLPYCVVNAETTVKWSWTHSIRYSSSRTDETSCRCMPHLAIAVSLLSSNLPHMRCSCREPLLFCLTCFDFTHARRQRAMNEAVKFATRCCESRPWPTSAPPDCRSSSSSHWVLVREIVHL